VTLPAGYDERKAFPLMTFLTAYFPDAIEALVKLSIQGNVQHDFTEPKDQPFYLKGDRIAWDRSKSAEQIETAGRHGWDHARAKRGVGAMADADGHLHAVKAAWRWLAEAQLTIESLRKGDSSNVDQSSRSSGSTASAGGRDTPNSRPTCKHGVDVLRICYPCAHEAARAGATGEGRGEPDRTCYKCHGTGYLILPTGPGGFFRDQYRCHPCGGTGRLD